MFQSVTLFKPQQRNYNDSNTGFSSQTVARLPSKYR